MTGQKCTTTNDDRTKHIIFPHVKGLILLSSPILYISNHSVQRSSTWGRTLHSRTWFRFVVGVPASLPDCVQGLGLSYYITLFHRQKNGNQEKKQRFSFLVFPYVFVFRCARLSWPSGQLLSARKSAISYRIVM